MRLNLKLRSFTISSVALAFIRAVIFGACVGTSVAASAVTAALPAASSRERSRLEELFIWKTSEELKLAPSVEQKYADTIHSLNTRRHEANAKMDAALASLGKAKTKSETEKALAAHRSALREVQAVQTAEIDRLRPLLGPEKLAQYIVVKSSILEKLKTMLAAPTAASSQGFVSTSASPSASPTP